MTLADLLEEALARQDKTKVDLAKHLAVSHTSLTKWTTKDPRDPIPWRHWRAICRYLDIPWRQWWAIAEREYPRHAAWYRRFSKLV